MADIGEMLRLARVEAGLTVREAAEASGRSKDSISKIERGLQTPTALTVGKLARAYGVSPAEYLADIPRKKASALPPGQRSFENHLAEEQRTEELEEIARLYRPCREGLDRYCERWEKKLAADALDRGSVEEFVLTSEDWLPILAEAQVSEALELSRVLDTNDLDKLWPKSVVKPVMDRYWTLIEKLRDEAGGKLDERKPELARDVIHLDHVRRRISDRKVS